ncbi:hypothetical protein [Nocardia fluminea]|uniref:hypothetical protein n=1 Tax=Nocardia fluminea TaxID=134984 RepID=UPI003650120F
MGKNFTDDPARDRRVYQAWMQLPPEPSTPFDPQPGGDIEVTEWDGITLEDGSHVLTTEIDGEVKLSVQNSNGVEVVVTLSWAVAQTIAAAINDNAAEAFRADHATWIATRRPEIEG